MREITYIEATREAVATALASDSTTFVIGHDVGHHGGIFQTTQGLVERFGTKRVREAPACERGIMGLCIGAAAAGARPIMDLTFVDYLLYGAGELAHQLALLRDVRGSGRPLPIVIRACIGIGLSAGPFHSGNYHSLFAHLPGLRVVAPSSPREGKGMLTAAVRGDEPVMLLEHKRLLTETGPVPDGNYETSLDRAAVVREGQQLTIVSYGGMLRRTLAAAEQLAEEQVQVEVIDLRSLAPLDMETLVSSVAKTGRALLVDDAYGPCSISAEIAARLASSVLDYLDAPVERLSGRHEPPPYSPALEASAAPSDDDIVTAARRLIQH
jgi:2-oxoisovalerate dehydrogenase E1 component